MNAVWALVVVVWALVTVFRDFSLFEGIALRARCARCARAAAAGKGRILKAGHVPDKKKRGWAPEDLTMTKSSAQGEHPTGGVNL